MISLLWGISVLSPCRYAHGDDGRFLFAMVRVRIMDDSIAKIELTEFVPASNDGAGQRTVALMLKKSIGEVYGYQELLHILYMCKNHM